MALRWRKKPVVIEAFQLCYGSWPDWFADAVHSGSARMNADGSAYIDTLEGTHKANPDDWILRGVNGEIYPCKSDIFGKTYDPA